MKKILIFAGTTEGRQLSDWLCERQIPNTVCVATEYRKRGDKSGYMYIGGTAKPGSEYVYHRICGKFRLSDSEWEISDKTGVPN